LPSIGGGTYTFLFPGERNGRDPKTGIRGICYAVLENLCASERQGKIFLAPPCFGVFLFPGTGTVIFLGFFSRGSPRNGLNGSQLIKLVIYFQLRKDMILSRSLYFLDWNFWAQHKTDGGYRYSIVVDL